MLGIILFINTVIFLIGAIAWSKRTQLNLFIKVVLWILLFLNAFCLLERAGYIVKQDKPSIEQNEK